MARTEPRTSRRRPIGGSVTRIAAAAMLALTIAACSGAGGIASYKSDSSYGCRPGATKTVCPR